MCLLSALQYKTQYNYNNRRGGAGCGAEPATDPPRLPISSTRRAFQHVNTSQKRAQTPHPTPKRPAPRRDPTSLIAKQSPGVMASSTLFTPCTTPPCVKVLCEGVGALPRPSSGPPQLSQLNPKPENLTPEHRPTRPTRPGSCVGQSADNIQPPPCVGTIRAAPMLFYTQTSCLVKSSCVRQQQARSAAASSHIQQQPAVLCSARATPMLIYTQTSCLVKSLAGSLRSRESAKGLTEDHHRAHAALRQHTPLRPGSRVRALQERVPRRAASHPRA